VREVRNDSPSLFANYLLPIANLIIESEYNLQVENGSQDRRKLEEQDFA